MSGARDEHGNRWHDDLAAYALSALDEREAALLERHLEDCASCSERLTWLSSAIDMLPASVPQLEPPPELRVRLLEVVEREAAAESERSAPAPAAKRRRRITLPVFGGFALRPALAGFGVALLLVAGIAGYALNAGSTIDTESYAALPTAPRSIAAGTLEVTGDEGSLKVAHLPAVRRGEVYQAWIQHTGQNGRIAPSSVFVVDDAGAGEVAIPHGLDGAERVMVTREPEGGSEKPTEGALLVANID